MANKQNAEAGFAAAPGSAAGAARDWHWTLRSMETEIGPLCVDCGENVPESGQRCDECRMDEWTE
jgi:hypothetical protein